MSSSSIDVRELLRPCIRLRESQSSKTLVATVAVELAKYLGISAVVLNEDVNVLFNAGLLFSKLNVLDIFTLPPLCG